MQWISSYGGPYVCTDRLTAESWLGTGGLSLKTDSAAQSDYVLACETNDYADIISPSYENVLVLGDLPEDMTWVPLEASVGIFIKWVGADSEEQVQLAVAQVAEQKFTDLGLNFLVNTTPTVVFDSACTVRDAEFRYLEFELPVGTYAVSICELNRHEFARHSRASQNTAFQN